MKKKKWRKLCDNQAAQLAEVSKDAGQYRVEASVLAAENRTIRMSMAATAKQMLNAQKTIERLESEVGSLQAQLKQAGCGGPCTAAKLSTEAELEELNRKSRLTSDPH